MAYSMILFLKYRGKTLIYNTYIANIMKIVYKLFNLDAFTSF